MTLKKSIKDIKFEDGLIKLTLPELKTTLTESQIGYGNKMDHFNFIENIQNIAKENNLETEIGDIFVRTGGPSQFANVSLVKREAERYITNNPLEAYVMRKLVTKLDFPQFNNTEMKLSIGIGYNQKGYQVAFGTNVNVCNNMCIWGDNYLQTYGPGKLAFDLVFQRLNDWMSLANEKWKQYLEFVNKLKERKLAENLIFAFLGYLLNKAVINEEQDVFTVTQVSKMTRNLVKNGGNDAWQLYNAGTNVLVPSSSRDFEPIYRQNREFAREIVEFIDR